MRESIDKDTKFAFCFFERSATKEPNLPEESGDQIMHPYGEDIIPGDGNSECFIFQSKIKMFEI